MVCVPSFSRFHMIIIIHCNDKRYCHRVLNMFLLLGNKAKYSTNSGNEWPTNAEQIKMQFKITTAAWSHIYCFSLKKYHCERELDMQRRRDREKKEHLWFIHTVCAQSKAKFGRFKTKNFVYSLECEVEN